MKKCLTDNAALLLFRLCDLSVGSQEVDVYGLGNAALSVHPTARLGTGLIDLYALD